MQITVYELGDGHPDAGCFVVADQAGWIEGAYREPMAAVQAAINVNQGRPHDHGLIPVTRHPDLPPLYALPDDFAGQPVAGDWPPLPAAAAAFADQAEPVQDDGACAVSTSPGEHIGVELRARIPTGEILRTDSDMLHYLAAIGLSREEGTAWYPLLITTDGLAIEARPVRLPDESPEHDDE